MRLLKRLLKFAMISIAALVGLLVVGLIGVKLYLDDTRLAALVEPVIVGSEVRYPLCRIAAQLMPPHA